MPVALLLFLLSTFNKVIEKRGYLLFFPQISTLFPTLSGWNEIRRAVQPMLDIFTGAVVEHEVNPADPSHPRDFIDLYLNEIQKTTDPNSSFYRDAGRMDEI